MIRILLILVACVLVSFNAHAIEFDVWRTGMSLREMVAVASTNNIPLAQKGLIAGGKGFNPRLINENFYKKSMFTYHTDLLGKRCVVTLMTTDEEPKWLYEIEVSFVGAIHDKGFAEELLRLMKSKYGRPGIKREAIYRHYLWKQDGKGEVVLKNYSSQVLSYIDPEIKKLALTQRTYQYQNKKNGYTKRDSDRF